MKFYICDDNKQELERYKGKLMRLAAQYNINLNVTAFESGREMLFQLEDEVDIVDAIFLDINMPNLNGIEVAKKLQELGFTGELIFLTVSEQHFRSAFDVGAFNYIIKDEDDNDRFELIFLRAVRVIEDKSKEYIVLVSAGRHKKIDIRSIQYFEVIRKVVTVYYDEDETFDFSSTIKRVEHELIGKGFIRINKSTIVNVRAVKTFGFADIELHNGKRLAVGRTYSSDVSAKLKEYHGKTLK